MKRFDIGEGPAQEPGLSRKDFLGTLGIGLGLSSLALASLGADPQAALAAAPSGKKAILYDSSKCVGCHYCEGGCKNANGLPSKVVFNIEALPETVLPKRMIPGEMLAQLDLVTPVTEDDRDAARWLRVTEASIDLGGEKTEEVFVRHSCTHCGLCARVCPSGALSQREDGIVTVDSGKCIGCLYCYQACPFDVPRYKDEGSDRAVTKCSMCAATVDKGGQPACVEACPTGALTFGSFEDMAKAGQASAAALVSAGMKDARLYGEKELGGIGVISVLRYKPETYGLPELKA